MEDITQRVPQAAFTELWSANLIAQVDQQDIVTNARAAAGATMN
jgi:hypothetical protein